jgi:hypothetical protein
VLPFSIANYTEDIMIVGINDGNKNGGWTNGQAVPQQLETIGNYETL